jgi:CheY-like chemotaxis protein
MKKVLLAWSPGPVLETLIGLLGGDGLSVFIATTAEEALALHLENNMDLIVADLDLPDMGGDTMCSRIREKEEVFRRVYIALICSGTRAEMGRCGRCGANSFLERPVDPGNLRERICRILESPERRATRVLAKVTVQGVIKNEPFFCSSRNISVTGILLETDRALARGDLISCSFFLPESERVETEARVVRVSRGEESIYLCGAEFVDMGPEQKAAIGAFVEKKRSEGNFI